MKKQLFTACILAVAMFTLTGCFGCTRIGAGYVGIVVNMSGDQKGVSELPTTTGWTWVNPITQNVYEYPTFAQTAIWSRSVNEGKAVNEEIAYNSVEGLVITSDISLTYTLTPEKVPYFYVKFRSDDLELFTHGYLRNVARDAFNEVASKMAVNDIYGSGKSKLLEDVKNLVNKSIEQYGVHIEQFGFTGEQRLPPQVVDALNNKIAANQNASRVENEIRMAEAEAKKKVALAKGEAEANTLLAKSISPQLIEWRRLQLMNDKWNGALPQVQAGNGLGVFVTPNK